MSNNCSTSSVNENDDVVEIRLPLASSSPTPQPQARKKRKNTSMVWDHFTRCSEYTDDDPHAKCNYCDMVYACHPRKNENSTMRMHLEHYCKKNPYQMKNRVFKNKESGDGNTTSVNYKMFTIENARRLIAEMIIIDEFSFKFVENEGFRRFVGGTLMLVEPKFVIPSRTTIARDILVIYANLKEQLRDIFVDEGYRVSLTTDTWTSIQNINYMVLTAHFIDRNWKLHKRIISFSQIENHRGEKIGKEVEKCLKQWGIERVLTLTVDNASSNDTAIAYLNKRFKHGLMLNGEFLHVRCCAHILNLIVCDGLKDVNDSLIRIRNAVRFVRSSPARLAKFKKCIEEENISSKSMLCLDVQTRWNSTYLMLDAAVKFEKVFERLEDYDIVYMNEESKPTTQDWEIARIFTKFLSVFYEVTVRLSGSLYVTSNIVFHEISIIQNCIRKYSSVTGLENLLLREMAMKMQEKYDKYWGKSEKTNCLLYVAFILDPRYKMKSLMYCLNQLFDMDGAKEVGNKVEDVLRKLFNEYSLSLVNCDSTSCSNSSSHMSKNCASKSQSSGSGCTEGDSSFMKQSTTTSTALEVFRFDFEEMDDDDTQNMDTEVDIYLLEPRVKREENFDILDWWKGNSFRYKVLSKIARDLLAIPVSIVASESAFSTSGRVIDPFRSSLAPTIVEALVCAQNWLCSKAISIDLQRYLDDIVIVEEDFKASLEAKNKEKNEKEKVA